MPKRSVDWNINFSKELLISKKDRKDYFLALIEEGFSWREALKQIIKTIGIKEYAELSGFKASNLSTQLKPNKDIRLSTLEKMIEPIGVSFTIGLDTEKEDISA
jgi:hypothetical protein